MVNTMDTSNSESGIATAERNLSQSNVSISGDTLKNIYGGTLSILPLDSAEKFWVQFYTDYFQKKLSRHDFFTSIWNSSLTITLEQMLALFNRLDTLFAEHDFDSEKFMMEVLPAVAQGIIVSSLKLLNIASPHLEQLFFTSDLREMMLTLFGDDSKKVVPGVVHRMIDHKTQNNYSTATILFFYSSISQYPLFYKKLPDYNFEIWTATYLRGLPRCFKLPRFEFMKILCDCKNIETVLGAENISFCDGDVYCNGTMIGKETTLFQHMNSYQQLFIEYNVPDCKIVHITHDFNGPASGIGRVSKGCCYGAPVYLYQLTYERFTKKPKEMFSEIINSLHEYNTDIWQTLKNNHEQIVNKKRTILDIVYDSSLTSISINNKHFVTNTPAKIFSKIIQKHLSDHQYIFEHREFSKDPVVIAEQATPNFVVRLGRLIDALNRDYPEIKIEKISRGKFKIAVDCAIQYREI